MTEQMGQPAAGVRPDQHETDAEDVHTPFDDELELWILASST